MVRKVDSGVKGIVVEVFGRGNVPPKATAEIVRAIENGVTVAFTTRTGDGRVELYPSFQEMGVISGEDLDGLKARMLLIVALGHTSSIVEIQAMYTKLSGAVAI